MTNAMELLTLIPVDRSMEIGHEFDETPPHITVLPWATVDDIKWPLIDAQLSDDISPSNREYDPLVVAAHTDLFGPESTVPVARLASIDFFAVHAMVLALFDRQGAVFDRTYTGVDGWHAHITLTDRDYEPYERIACNELAVAQRITDGLKRVKSVYRWRENGHVAATRQRAS